jgi:phosphoesterase RecJ-like protein
MTFFTKETIGQIETLFKNSQKFLLISHKSPDGDTLGCTTALYEILTSRGKQCTIACKDPAPEALQFLDHSDKIVHNFSVDAFDVIIICDVAAINLMGFFETHPEILTGNIPVINIDHHGSNENYGSVNIVETKAASTTTILADILFDLGFRISASAATSLLTGIYTDTGSFMHSNTDSYTLRVASRLLSLGANIRKIRHHIFKTTKVSTLKLWGRVLQNTYKDEDGVTVSVVTDDDFLETGADYTELTGVVDYINAVPNSQFSLLLTEKGDGNVKGSLRTLQDNVDVSEIAGIFGGGGHKKASGFTLPGKLQKEVRWTVVK